MPHILSRRYGNIPLLPYRSVPLRATRASSLCYLGKVGVLNLPRNGCQLVEPSECRIVLGGIRNQDRRPNCSSKVCDGNESLELHLECCSDFSQSSEFEASGNGMSMPETLKCRHAFYVRDERTKVRQLSILPNVKICTLIIPILCRFLGVACMFVALLQGQLSWPGEDESLVGAYVCQDVRSEDGSSLGRLRSRCCYVVQQDGNIATPSPRDGRLMWNCMD